jgi:hypothetical protein
VKRVHLFAVPHLSSSVGAGAAIENTIGWGGEVRASATGYNQLIGDDDVVLADIIRKPTGRLAQDDRSVGAADSGESQAYLRGGPRKHLHFDPAASKAAVVTHGQGC